MLLHVTAHPVIVILVFIIEHGRLVTLFIVKRPA